MDKHKPPNWVLDTMEEKIDCQTFETVTLPISKWCKLGAKGPCYKNPKTGNYTMVSVIVCRSCGEKIPVAGHASGSEVKGRAAAAAAKMTTKVVNAAKADNTDTPDNNDSVSQDSGPPPMSRGFSRCPKCGRRAR